MTAPRCCPRAGASTSGSSSTGPCSSSARSASRSAVTRIALASDDPGELVRRLAAARAAVAPGDGRAALSALGGLELAGGLRDALAPA